MSEIDTSPEMVRSDVEWLRDAADYVGPPLMLNDAHRRAARNVADLLEAVAAERDAARRLFEGPWEDKADDWSPSIDAAHPMNTIDNRDEAHARYIKALEMVGNRHSKGSLVALVNWLLADRDEKLGDYLRRHQDACDRADEVREQRARAENSEAAIDAWDKARTEAMALAASGDPASPAAYATLADAEAALAALARKNRRAAPIAEQFQDAPTAPSATREAHK